MSKEKKPTPIESALTVYNTENLTMAAIKIFKDAEALECVDPESRKVIGKHRAQIKTFRIQVEAKRKEINREAQEKNNVNATLLTDILNLSFSVFDEKIKAYDAVAEEKRVAKAKIESDRLEKLETYIASLDKCIVQGQRFGLTSKVMTYYLTILEGFEISSVDFQERTEQAECSKETGIETLKRMIEEVGKLESDQAEAAKLKEDNEAAAKKLADDQAAFKAIQDKAVADKKAADDSAKKLAAQEAEKTAKANAELKAGQEALAKAAEDLKAKEDAATLKEYTGWWDEAHKMNLDMKIAWATDIAGDYYSMDWDAAILFEAAYNDGVLRTEEINANIQKDKLKADKARAKVVVLDKELLTGYHRAITVAFDTIMDMTGPATREGKNINHDFLEEIETALEQFKNQICDLA